jgi:hypothetical protein
MDDHYAQADDPGGPEQHKRGSNVTWHGSGACQDRCGLTYEERSDKSRIDYASRMHELAYAINSLLALITKGR